MTNASSQNTQSHAFCPEKSAECMCASCDGIAKTIGVSFCNLTQNKNIYTTSRTRTSWSRRSHPCRPSRSSRRSHLCAGGRSRLFAQKTAVVDRCHADWWGVQHRGIHVGKHTEMRITGT